MSSASFSDVLFDAQSILSSADLANGVLASTRGTGTNAQITLDDDAAGYGWFIDYTPYLNSEYLPTSNPYEWIARPGTVSDGRMDMLSVLFHEYGHALGLEHSTDTHNFMSVALQPGIRRLPSVEELKLMESLASGLKSKIDLTSSSTQQQPDASSPYASFFSGFIDFFTAQQRDAKNPGTVAGDTSYYEVAANPAFVPLPSVSPSPTSSSSVPQVSALRPSVRAPASPTTTLPESGWLVTGDVSFGNGSAVLKETGSTQTRLNQIFVLGEKDRVLSFTLSDLNLDDVNNAPDDALEVALINANTGKSLLGGVGLSKTDAVLNLQANGTEYKAQGVTTVKNPDGSITVTVDLNHIPAGTAVNLSFDLIGFGRNPAAQTSRATLGALRLAETDNPDNPDNPDKPIDPDKPNQPNQPDTPDASWSNAPWDGTENRPVGWGERSEPQHSASDTLSRQTENQAPTASGFSLRLNENTPIVLDLLGNAHDPDGDTLTVIIVSAPRYGKLIANPDGTYTYVPDEGYTGEDSFTYKVSDGKHDSNIVTITLVVVSAEEEAVELPETEESVNGKQNADGTQTTDSDGNESPGKSATITLQSELAYSFNAPRTDSVIILRGKQGETRVETQDKAPQKPKIDWNGILPAFIVTAPLLATPFLPAKKEQDGELTPQRLAEITGLKIPMDKGKGKEKLP